MVWFCGYSCCLHFFNLRHREVIGYFKQWRVLLVYERHQLWLLSLLMVVLSSARQMLSQYHEVFVMLQHIIKTVLSTCHCQLSCSFMHRIFLKLITLYFNSSTAAVLYASESWTLGITLLLHFSMLLILRHYSVIICSFSNPLLYIIFL
jgi:hypothetical protein